MSKYVLVDTVLSYRIRYVIELDDNDPNEYALDTVVCNEATEFSQEFIGEHIVSYRQVTEEEVIRLCDEDNDYIKSWDNQMKLDTFITKLVKE